MRIEPMSSAPFPHPVPPLTEREFALFQRLVYREAGIFLSDAKRALLYGRLTRRIRELGLGDFSAYYKLVEQNVAGERTRALDAICTNETKFFREPKQFEFLNEHVLPHWRLLGERGTMPRRVRAWSAACSTGEEPYSIAMTLASALPDWNTSVIASDLSTKALNRAKEGVWPIERAEDIPQHYRKRFLLRGVRGEEGKMRATPALASMIEFKQINLNDPEYLLEGSFDLIFCRNVLIYFDRESKRRVIEKLLRRLTPNGILFLGHAETLNGIADGVRTVGPTAYSRATEERQ